MLVAWVDYESGDCRERCRLKTSHMLCQIKGFEGRNREDAPEVKVMGVGVTR